MELSAAFVITLLTFWQVLIVVSQLNNGKVETLYSCLRINISSRWGVFCAPPRRHRIFVRDWDEDRPIDDWKELELLGQGGWLKLIWNPEMWHDTAQQTLLRWITDAALADPIQLNVPLERVYYIEILRDYLSKSPVSFEEGATRRQFRVSRTWGFFPERPAERVFESELFELKPV